MENNQQRTDEIEIDLREIAGVLFSKLGIIILSGIILALFAMVGTKLFITPQYESTTKMYVLTKQDGNTLTSGDMQTSTLLTKDYAELIKSRTVIEGVAAQLDLDLGYDKLLDKVTVTTPTDTRILTISVSDPDPYTAAKIADAVRDAAAEHIQTVMNTEAVNVVESANIPSKPSRPSAMKNGAIGGVLGVFLAIAVVLVSYLMNDTIKTSDDIEKYLNLSTLGNLPLVENETKSSKRHNKKTASKNNKRR